MSIILSVDLPAINTHTHSHTHTHTHAHTCQVNLHMTSSHRLKGMTSVSSFSLVVVVFSTAEMNNKLLNGMTVSVSISWYLEISEWYSLHWTYIGMLNFLNPHLQGIRHMLLISSLLYFFYVKLLSVASFIPTQHFQTVLLPFCDNYQFYTMPYTCQNNSGTKLLAKVYVERTCKLSSSGQVHRRFFLNHKSCKNKVNTNQA